MLFADLSLTVNIMAAIVITLGFVTVALALVVAAYFNKSMPNKSKEARRLSLALQYQLIGESIISTGTLAFAIATFTGSLQDWSIYLVTAIRVIMFGASGFTTAYLYHTVKRL